MTLYQFKEDVEPLLRAEVRVELIVGPVRIFETAKDLNDSVHAMTVPY